ncbi:MAG TPA: hypothetical protein VLO11_05595 [Luteolibacter sp.]|nr:hypothetical protein [Luteolibacter sp.]
MNTPKPIPSQSLKRGFALVVTLSMMILLTVIAVGLLGLSAVSLRSSSDGQAQAEARANARLALMLALGQLQKEMGPDSRISAAYDAGSAATGGQPHWTAVYDAWRRPEDPNMPDTPQSRSPTFRGWLVSGANGAGAPAGVGKNALLVGRGSLGNDALPEDEIRVPMQAVTVGRQKGHFAWWASDESMKAKVNAGSDTELATNPLFGSQSAPHIGHRAIEVLKDFEWKPGQRRISVTNASVNLAAGLGNRGIGNLDHDITVHSTGLLCDVRGGHLKRDLSQLLARPVETIEDMPLYLADGRVNRFQIGENGSVANSSIVTDTKSAPNTPREWGINLEELHLFHNIHRELDWSGGQPSLSMKTTREAAVKDRYYLYKRPVIDAVQFILSLKAEQFQGNYRMVMMLDGMVALSNPGDVPITWPPGLIFPVQLQNIPYNLKWNITNADGQKKNTNTASSADFGLFVGRIGGGTRSKSAGFTLEPGEAAVFGSTSGNGPQLDLMRGFLPSGGVRINPSANNGWDLKAAGLKADDKIAFTLTKGDKGYKGGYTYYNAWIGDRRTGNNATGWQIDSLSLSSAGDINSEYMNRFLISPIRESEVLEVSDFLAKPKPIMMISFLRNVERDALSSEPPMAVASRPFQLNEAVTAFRGMAPSTMESAVHLTQYLITAEPLNYQFRTLAAGDGGRNVYQGGGRQPNLGGSFNVIRRRTPIAPPMSLGSFENAIASGFSSRMRDAPNIANDPYPDDAMALSGQRGASFAPAKVIGNSWANPFVPQDAVFKPSTGGQPASRASTDHSWMANTALWDTWFLSSIVDGRGRGGNSYQQDTRSPRKQFEDLAGADGSLRNSRYVFHPHRSPDEAVEELFVGETFNQSALNKLAKYLLVDGAFNVNSTSENAWKALLTSVRDQELLVNGGGTKKFDCPYGTLGYAHDTSTSNDWTGLRDLSDTEIGALAGAIVNEVKARGPFLSLADFVNRRPNGSDPNHQVLGALQSAIGKSGLNERFTGGGRSVTAEDFGALSGAASINEEHAPARSLGCAGHLSQARLLTALGAQITVRSDTFAIRTYGDARDPAGKILARAWCEAVVQRVPEYVDSTDLPEAHDGWPQPGSKLSPANSRFGRRWEIKSFRWLDSGEMFSA